MEDSSIPWAPPSSAPERHSQQPPDGTMAAPNAVGPSRDYDPMLGGLGAASSLPLGTETHLQRGETQIGDSFLSSLHDINVFYEVNDLLQSTFPTLPLTPADLGATGDTQYTPQPPQTLLSATEYPQCHGKMEGSSAFNVVGERVVAGVNGVVPAMDEEMPPCANSFKTFDYTGASEGETGVPMSANSLKTFDYVDASEGETEVPMCANSLKTFDYIGASKKETEVPVSAKTGSQAYYGASAGETRVATSANMVETRSQTNISASGVLKETEVGMPMSASSAKTGSQAFNYIGTPAVLETYGIPVFPHLSPTPHTSSGTPKASGTVAAPSIISKNLDLCNQAGTIDNDSKEMTVPLKALVNNLLMSDQSGTVNVDPNKSTVPGEMTGTIKYLPQPHGTVNIGPKESTMPVKSTATIRVVVYQSGTVEADPNGTTVPRETNKYLSQPPGTVIIIPKESTKPGKTTETNNNHGNVALSPQTYAGPSGTSEDADEAGMSGNAKKRRRRRKKQAEGEDAQQRKVPKYELGPLDDATEERKRRDAIRAKCGRERNKLWMQELNERLQEVEEERDRLASERDQLVGEVAGRQAWETTLLTWLREERNIDVAPYGTVERGAQQMSPAQPILTSPAQPSR